MPKPPPPPYEVKGVLGLSKSRRALYTSFAPPAAPIAAKRGTLATTPPVVEVAPVSKPLEGDALNRYHVNLNRGFAAAGIPTEYVFDMMQKIKTTEWNDNGLCQNADWTSAIRKIQADRLAEGETISREKVCENPVLLFSTAAKMPKLKPEADSNPSLNP